MKDDYIYIQVMQLSYTITQRTAHDTDTDTGHWTGMTDALVNIGDVCCLLTCSNPRIRN